MPADFLVFGGGWKNPLALNDFKCLLRGEGLVLPEHQETFAAVQSRFERPPSVEWSDKFGYSGQYMEARIFADMAYCRIVGKPFTFRKAAAVGSRLSAAFIFCLLPAEISCLRGFLKLTARPV